MKVLSILFLSMSFSALAHAVPPNYVRGFTCDSANGRFEIYFDEELAKRNLRDRLHHNVRAMGHYAIDLTKIGKGKLLEPVYFLITDDRKNVVMEHYTRPGVKDVLIPFDGGTVDLDNSTGSGARCDALNATGIND